MRIQKSLDGLTERFERLVLHRSDSYAVTDVYRKLIAHKLADKSLQELQDIVSQLETNISSCEE